MDRNDKVSTAGKTGTRTTLRLEISQDMEPFILLRDIWIHTTFARHVNIRVKISHYTLTEFWILTVVALARTHPKVFQDVYPQAVNPHPERALGWSAVRT